MTVMMAIHGETGTRGLIVCCAAALRGAARSCVNRQGSGRKAPRKSTLRACWSSEEFAGTEERENQPITLRQGPLPFAPNVFGPHAVGREHKDDRLRLIQRAINFGCPIATRCEMIRVQPSRDPLPVEVEGERLRELKVLPRIADEDRRRRFALRFSPVAVALASRS